MNQVETDDLLTEKHVGILLHCQTIEQLISFLLPQYLNLGGLVMCKFKTSACIAIIIMLLVATAAVAAPIRVDYSGTLDSVSPELSPFFAISDTFAGSYIFDSNALDVDLSSALGVYPNAITSASISISTNSGTYNAAATSGTIQVFDAPPPGIPDPDLYTAFASVVSGDPVQGNPPASFGPSLSDSTLMAIQSDALPTTLNLGGFDTREFFFSFFNPATMDNDLSITGTIDSLSFTPVPVPSAVLLMGTGLLGLIGWRWMGTKP